MNIDKKQLNIANNYANALFEISKEQNNTEKIYNQFKNIIEIISNARDLKLFFENPLISSNDKKEIIYKIFGKDFDLQLINILNILSDNKRLDLLETILYCFEKIYEKDNNLIKASVYSVTEMNDETKNRIKEKLENKLNKKTILAFNKDEKIIGGLVIKIQDKIIDLSLRKKFKDMEKQLI